MKILYAGWEKIILPSGVAEFSFEHVNFYQSLAASPGASVDYYKVDMACLRGGDAKAVSREIAARAAATQPDVLFLLMNHDYDREALRAIRRDPAIATAAFFSDEDTDLYLRSLDWAGAFDWIVTFYPPAFEEYRRRGVNVIGINWAANPDFWKPAAAAKKTIDVSFIGAAKDERKAFIKELAARGVAVECYGAGWPNGPVSFERMREIINRSKICLNLGFAKPILRPQSLARIFISPMQHEKGYRFDAWHAGRNLKTILNRRRPQSRARPFELAAAGAFVLTNRNAPLFGEPFAPDKEMVYYDGVRDAVRKIQYYLAPARDTDREAIAAAARARVVRDHSFQKKFADILALIAKDPKPKTPVAKILT